MKVREKGKDGKGWHGWTDGFNTHGIGEVIVGFADDPDGQPNGMDSMFIRDCEVFLEAKQEWKDMSQAFKDRDLIIDNYNTRFGEPKNEEDRARGYWL